MEILSLSASIVFTIYLALGVHVLILEPKSKLNRIYAVLSLSIAIWAFSYFFMYSEQDVQMYHMWHKIASLGYCTFAGMFLHFVLVFTKKDNAINRFLMSFLLYFPALIFVIESFRSDFSVKGIIVNKFATFEVRNIDSLFFWSYVTYISACIIIGLILIWIFYTTTDKNIQKKQAKLVLVTSLVASGIGFAANIILPGLKMYIVPPIAVLALVVWELGIWYSIGKYKLMVLSPEIAMDEIISKIKDLLIMVDNEFRIVIVNDQIKRILNYQEEELVGQLLDTIIYKSAKEEFDNIKQNVKENDTFETVLGGKDGDRIPVKAFLSQIKNKVGDYCGIILIAQDLRDTKKLMHLGLHDPLTDLYNRTFFEREIEKLEDSSSYPLTFIICDVDGLKFVNDTLGHKIGDALLVVAAEVIKKSFRSTDIVARIGGDEFAVLLNYADEEIVLRACKNIQQSIEKYNFENYDLPLSISVGYAIAKDKDYSTAKLFKEADNNMYRDKLNHSQSARSQVIKTLMNALEARDYFHDGHSIRMQKIVEIVGIKLGFSQKEINNLKLLAQFHDIGKVGISDKILFKKGKLTPEEYAELQRHSEIGYRIAQSSPGLVHIAEDILNHHEWWNGKGYPLGSKGEEIPLEARIISIADSFDSMTSYRPYKEKLSFEQSMDELKRGAGTQFDPELVNIIVKALEENRDYFLKEQFSK